MHHQLLKFTVLFNSKVESGDISASNYSKPVQEVPATKAEMLELQGKLTH
jgi:hypothetical protein